MNRNFVVGLFGGLIGSAMLLIVLSAASIVGARSADMARSAVSRPSEVSAATPLTSTFTYQGQLKTSSGSPISDTCGFQFGLWDSASGLAQIGLTQTVSSVSVSRGLFTALLNTGNEFGGTAFNGDARWLQIAVRCPDSGNYTAMSTRQPLTSLPFALPGLRTFPNATSPNIIGGYSGNFISATVVGAVIAGGGESGYPNRVQADYGTVSGGERNTASKYDATVSGGFLNTANGDDATVSGGEQNTASDNYATVGGGDNNTAGYAATVGRGEGNIADNDFASISGGYYNTASGRSAFVGGCGWVGYNYSGNHATGNASTIGGGLGNTASGVGAFVGGGGYDGSTSDGNQATGNASTIGGGFSNLASGGYATVDGGISNTASFTGTTVGGGYNRASNWYATVAGGQGNNASGDHATIGGGENNIASGYNATVPGGWFNTAAGDYSFAAGQHANASKGTFVWADSSTSAEFASTANNQFLVRASGGITLYTNSGATIGAALAPGSGSWSLVSDRNLKENFTSVDSRDILARLAMVPIQTWNYTTQAAAIRHIGPMAQDFASAFNVGENNTTISTVDAQGVALAAIQGLYQTLQDKDAQIAQLQTRVSSLEQNQQPASFNGFNLLSVIAFGAVVVMWLQQRRSKRGEA